MSPIKSYRDLQVWQRGVDIALLVYRLTESFPRAEIYGLTSQMRRAAVSIASNIAEGHSRSNKQFGHYLETALGSLAELETQLEIARRIGYLAETDQQPLTQELDILGRQLNTFRRRLTAHQRPAADGQSLNPRP